MYDYQHIHQLLPTYPLISLDPTKPLNEESDHVVLCDYLRMVFWMKMNEEALTCTVNEIGDMHLNDIDNVVKLIKISCIIKDK